MRCLRPHRIFVTDSASPLKPLWVDDVSHMVWCRLDDNYGHSNDIGFGKISTKYSGFTRSVLAGAMYALCCDADYYVYVEQDCLVFGEDILPAAIGSSEAHILLGQPTRNGVGLGGGIALPMLQQSFMIVGRPGIERFISGILRSPFTDGERSPEETMRLELAPFDLLSIPYGRTRPIDPMTPSFYAQHLTTEELGLLKARL